MAFLREDAGSRMMVRCQGITEHTGTLTYAVYLVFHFSEMGMAIMASFGPKDVSPDGIHSAANCCLE
jgi:hypothetical protein